MLRVAPLLLLFFACDSTALSLADPTSLEVVFEPAFRSPTDVGDLEVSIEFQGVADAGDDTGSVRELVDHDFTVCAAQTDSACTAIELKAFEFLTNWRLRMTLGEPNVGADQGRYDLSLRVRNAYGTFSGTGEFFVFSSSE